MSIFPDQFKEGIFGVTATVKSAHSGGAIHETTLYTPEYSEIEFSFDGSNAKHIKLAMEYGVLKMEGIEVKSEKLCCKTCGKRVLFPVLNG